jgi:hypothetical protein
VPALRAAIAAALRRHEADGDSPAGTAARCRDSLARAGQSLLSAAETLTLGGGDELVAVDLRQAIDELGKVVGAPSSPTTSSTGSSAGSASANEISPRRARRPRRKRGRMTRILPRNSSVVSVPSAVKSLGDSRCSGGLCIMPRVVVLGSSGFD